LEVPDGPVSPAAGLGQVVDREPTPAFAAEAAEAFRLLLDALPDEVLRRIAVAKMESYRNEEIAKMTSLSLRAVERHLRLIRQTWQEVPHDA
jgi:DNA-directed RNA polymerase specialized sigma24 family protein